MQNAFHSGELKRTWLDFFLFSAIQLFDTVLIF